MLSFNLTLNEFMPREKAGTAEDQKFSEAAASRLQHNHGILAFYLQKTNPERFNEIFGKEPLKGCSDLVQIVKARCNRLNLFKSGIRTAHAHGSNNSKRCWIHHAFLLQFVHPRIHNYIQEAEMKDLICDDGNLDDFISFAQQQKEGSDEFSKVAVWKGSSNIGNRGSAALAEKATEDKSVVTLTCCDDVVGSGVPRKKASGGESEVASMGTSKIFTADAAAIATHVTARITASNPAIAAATKFSVNNIDKDVDAADCLFDMEEDDNYHPLNTAVSTAMTRTMEEIEIIPSVDNRLAPQDSGLQHFTSKLKKDIGYYFTLKPTDPVLCNEYVTDIFKSLYAAEVSTNELSKIIVPIDRSHASSSFVVD
jgi:hypothetical protein